MQDSTKYSPFYLVYGRQARLPVEFNVTSTEERENSEDEAENSEDEGTKFNESDDGGESDDRGKSDVGGDCDNGGKGDEREQDNNGDESKDKMENSDGWGNDEGDGDGKQSDNEEKSEDGGENMHDEGRTEIEDGESRGNDGEGGSDEVNMPNLDLEKQMENMISIREKALKNIEVAQARQKKYYDAKHCKDRGKYKVGALVLLKNSKKLSRKGSKMEQNWSGPYLIHDIVGKNTYRLCNRRDNKILRNLVNMARLKLYFEDQPSTSHPKV